MDVLEKRRLLRAIPVDARRQWAVAFGRPCRACQDSGRPCVYPSHWSGDVLTAACSALLDGKGDGGGNGSGGPTPAPSPKKPQPGPGAEGRLVEVLRLLLEETGFGSRERLVADIRDEVLDGLEPGLASRITEAVQAAIAALPPAVHRVEVSGRPPVEVNGVLHEAFDRVLRRAQARVPTLLVGPTGSGKTHLAAQVAQALGLPFRFTSASAGMTEGALVGRLLPLGDHGRFEYLASEFVTTYEGGGVFLLDEVDAADPQVLLRVNAAIANGHIGVDLRQSQPVAAKHRDFILIAAANTYGTGASRQYVGRNQLDAATLDRFGMGVIEVDYDRKLESQLIPQHICEWGWGVRKVIEENRMRRILSTRNMLDAARLEATGCDKKDWRKSYFSGWGSDELAKFPADLLP